MVGFQMGALSGLICSLGWGVAAFLRGASIRDSLSPRITGGLLIALAVAGWACGSAFAQQESHYFKTPADVYVPAGILGGLITGVAMLTLAILQRVRSA